MPVPALFAAVDPTTDVRDSLVLAGDADAVAAYFKRSAKAGTAVYEQDLDGNGVADGIQYDRSSNGTGGSGPPDGVITGTDEQLAFAQFKRSYHC